jgi:hypothetical protein
MTVAEIAPILKLNQHTVRSWIDRDELPAVIWDGEIRDPVLPAPSSRRRASCDEASRLRFASTGHATALPNSAASRSLPSPIANP